MNHANQLIFEIIGVQKFSILVPKFKDILKNISKQGFAHFSKTWGHTHKTHYIHQHKQSFQFQHFNFFHRNNIFFSQTKFNIV